MEQTRTTGYRVFPYVARITLPDRWQIAAREIAEIVDVRLSDLISPGAHDKMIERFPTWQKAEQVSVLSHRRTSALGIIVSDLATDYSASGWRRLECVKERSEVRVRVKNAVRTPYCSCARS